MLKLSGLNDILECYHENIWPDQDAYYFFDEIQYASDWDKWMKTLYDMQPRTHMVATGSDSPTLSFFEYCALIGLDVPDLGPDIRPTAFSRMTHHCYETP